MARGSAETKERIVQAAARLLARDGHRAVGINAVAEEAGTDKVLIYRYFGGLPGLLGTVARSHPLWPSADALVRSAPSLEHALHVALLETGRAIRERAVARELLVWELAERNEVTAELAAVRERETEALIAALRSRFPVPQFLDLPALYALLSSALAYLALRATGGDGDRTFTLAPSTEPDWRRIERATAATVRAVVGVMGDCLGPGAGGWGAGGCG
ncbi:MAG TPA: helix-turn-helix domain-containing protein, partial [Gemmatimonadaceae bacterium]|nr:helix-turn-helix domain-containing protein [Gemmatimonadaceae bacterium]